jgi:hypothetical protein
MFLIAREHADIKEALSRLPWVLVPAVNRIAAEIASTQGWKVENNYDFLVSTNPRSIELCRLALAAIIALEDFCQDEWGTSLDELVAEEG